MTPYVLQCSAERQKKVSTFVSNKQKYGRVYIEQHLLLHVHVRKSWSLTVGKEHMPSVERLRTRRSGICVGLKQMTFDSHPWCDVGVISWRQMRSVGNSKCIQKYEKLSWNRFACALRHMHCVCTTWGCIWNGMTDHEKWMPSNIGVPLLLVVGRHTAVGIATRYGLGGQGIECRWAEIFHTRPTSCIMSAGSFLGIKRQGSGVNHPIPI